MQKKNSKKIIIPLLLLLCLLLITLLIYPNIEFRKNGKLYVCSFSDDFSEFEESPSYNELYFYNEERDISIKTFDVKNFLCFYLFTFEYIEGDARETQFVLEEEFISHWLKNAKITENPDNIDVAKLIEGKKAIVGNTRYFTEDDKNCIFYELDGDFGEMYIFESNGFTVIQIGSPDELPKFIAYK